MGLRRSYPTYEEWKPATSVISFTITGSSYPTYEEWKHEAKYTLLVVKSKVLILPMRNGNPDFLQASASISGVLILPMRNGN